MEFIGLIPEGCPRCERSVKVYTIMEPVTGKGRCVTITMRCNMCPWVREKHVKLSFMLKE